MSSQSFYNYPGSYPGYENSGFSYEGMLDAVNARSAPSERTPAEALQEYVVKNEEARISAGAAMWESKLAAPYEGDRIIIYIDGEGFRTTGRGKKLANLAEARQLASFFIVLDSDGSERVAKQEDIDYAWEKAPKSQDEIARLDARARAGKLMGQAFLGEGAVESFFAENRKEAIRGVKRLAKGSLGGAEPEVIAVMLDMQFAHGATSAAKFVKCNSALRSSMTEADPIKKAHYLEIAAQECLVGDVGQLERNPGWKKRNTKRAQLLREAADRFRPTLNRMQFVLP